MALLPESGGRVPASCSLLSPQSTEVASGGQGGKDRIHSKPPPGPATACLAGPGGGRAAAVLEGDPTPARGLQEALHEGQAVRVPPRVLGGTWGAHPRALGGLHLLSGEDAVLGCHGAQ